MTSSRELTIEQYRAEIGQIVGVSDWILIDQDRIDRFADVALDPQFIHIDPIRAAETPFGGTVAHGFLTLSLLAPMGSSAIPKIRDLKISVNYGMNSVRLPMAVRSGKRVRGHFTLKDCTERAAGQYLSTYGVSVEIEGETKPAIIAELLTLMFISNVPN